MDSFARLFLLTLLLAANPCFSEESDPPQFLSDLIAQFENGTVENSPGEIWKYSYRGTTVYYVPPRYCCDLPSKLYDSHGNLLCRPDGEFTGRGDGNCSAFIKERSNGEILWKDVRIEVEE